MSIEQWACQTPDEVAVRMAGSGETVTFAQLDQAANQAAQLMRTLGLQRGDVFATFAGNSPRYVELAFAMSRTGLYMVPIASKLKAPEATYIANDSGARVLIVDAGIGEAAAELARNIASLCPHVEKVFAMRGDLAGAERWEEAIAAMPATPIADQSPGTTMIYSSGTTGKPKGVHRALPEGEYGGPDGYLQYHQHLFRTEPGTPFLVTAPSYHSGPLAFIMAELRLGASILVFEKFDAEKVLQAIDTWKPKRGQFVPTMFVRMLKLPEAVRAKYDCSSMQVAMHSAAPCPVEVKRAMIEWWGPVLYEIYGGTENAGSTMIDSHEWLTKPGSVGKASTGTIHICDEAGNELPPGETGIIYFEGNAGFKYLNDDGKTRDSRHPSNSAWATFGDIGHVDEDGYLFLSDRRAFMIICGGVNIYPQEAEDTLIMHPGVADVAVFGIPDPDMGEQVKAVVQPAPGTSPGSELEAELIAWCKERLASLKCPRSIDFEAELPRDPTGKMMKRQIRERYWREAGATPG